VVCRISPAHKDGFARAVKDKPFAVVGRCLGSRKDPDIWSELVVELEDCRAAP
jgi:hypothetical protein